MSRKYEKVQELYPTVKRMVEEGYTQREIAEQLGLDSKDVVRNLLNRQRRKEDKIAHGIIPGPKGRPGKGAPKRDIVEEQADEIRRLKMENELLRDFLSLIGKE